MTQLRSILARRDALAALGVDWGIGPLLRLGKGESASGGAARPSNLADAVEAVVGAVWRDGGYRAGHKVFQSQFEPRLREWLQLEGRPLEAENPKGTLQEWLQQRGDPPPEYRIVSEAGPAHDRRYEASVWWKGTELARGEGAGKRAAEARAAAAALQKLRADEVSLP